MGQAALTHSSSTGLWLSGHQQGLYSQPHLPSLSHPVGNLQGISGKKCSPEPVETKQPRGFLLPQSILHHLMEYHTLGKNTLPPSHSPATPVHPQPFLAPSTTFPIPTKEPFYCTGMSANHSSSPGLARKPHARGKSFPDSNDSHFLKGKFPYSAHSVLTRTAGDPPHEY